MNAPIRRRTAAATGSTSNASAASADAAGAKAHTRTSVLPQGARSAAISPGVKNRAPAQGASASVFLRRLIGARAFSGPARTPRHLADDGLAVADELEHGYRGGHVELLVIERKGVRVGDPEGRAGDRLPAGDGDHLRRDIHSGHPETAGAEERAPMAGPAAYVEQAGPRSRPREEPLDGSHLQRVIGPARARPVPSVVGLGDGAEVEPRAGPPDGVSVGRCRGHSPLNAGTMCRIFPQIERTVSATGPSRCSSSVRRRICAAVNALS